MELTAVSAADKTPTHIGLAIIHHIMLREHP